MSVRYLSLEWIQAIQAAIDEAKPDTNKHDPVGITQVVTGGPEGTVLYHLQASSDSLRFAAGPADLEDVRFTQSWETAVAVATEQLAAPEAFLKGLITIEGDTDKLVASQPVFAALEPIFQHVRAQTTYA
jgi:hypothetical protein